MSFYGQAEKWLSFYRVGKADITVHRNWRLLELYVFPYIGDKEIGELSRLELVEIVERVASGGAYENAKKVAGVITMVMDNAVNRGVVDYSVAQRLSSVVPVHRTSGHAAITDPKSLGVLLKAIESDNTLTDSVYYTLRILPYVFVRNSELRCATWDEFNLESGEWVIPAERMKMRKTHFVPLATQVVDLLNELKSKGLSQSLLFPSPMSKTRPISDNTLQVALLRFGYARDQVSVHGFRKTASTLLHELGFDSILIERQLAHADRNTIRAIYNYAEYKEERTSMMQAWANYLDGLTEG